jgi:hypothetical protein
MFGQEPKIKLKEITEQEIPKQGNEDLICCTLFDALGNTTGLWRHLANEHPDKLSMFPL